MTTQADLLVLVQNRYPKLDSSAQNSIASMALHIMSEPQWVKMHIHPMVAVKMASHRISHRKSF